MKYYEDEILREYGRKVTVIKLWEDEFYVKIYRDEGANRGWEDGFGRIKTEKEALKMAEDYTRCTHSI